MKSICNASSHCDQSALAEVTEGPKAAVDEAAARVTTADVIHLLALDTSVKPSQTIEFSVDSPQSAFHTTLGSADTTKHADAPKPMPLPDVQAEAVLLPMDAPRRQPPHPRTEALT